MSSCAIWMLGFLLLIGACPHVSCKNMYAVEVKQSSRWTSGVFGTGTERLPFSFVYDGQPSGELLKTWGVSRSVRKIDENRTERVVTCTDPKTGLSVRCAIVEYRDFPTVEWTLYFKNAGKSDTPILENILALDTTLVRPETGEFTLHRFTGSPMTAGDYQPFADVMGSNAKKRIAGSGGRPTSSDMCYFNVESPGGQGLIIALGWPGQWAGDFVRDSGRSMRVTCGQELTHLKLHPGEEIRTPLVVLQFWQGGDWIRSQNIWRRWMNAHGLRRPGGKPIPPQYGGCGGNPLPYAAQEIEQINGYLRDGVKLDHWIIDAGWYVNNGSWTDTGTWEVDKKRFPKGLKEVADCIHQSGGQFIVWFEPERVSGGTWLADQHPEWVLGGKGGGLLNLGNPKARRWVINRVDRLLVSEGIDNYRGDYNIDPLSFWRNNDESDRQGMTENLYVQGFLAFWDELEKRHPGMYIDTCASGGRRNDLETLRRSVPLLRSDWPVFDFSRNGAIGQQCQTYGLSFWIPYHGTGAPCLDTYTLRSSYCPCYRIGYDASDPKRNVKLFQQAVGEIRQIQPYLLGDFYPLTPYSLEKTAWLAWQYDSPENGGGVVQAFRREQCAETGSRFKLGGLLADSLYELTDLDSGKPLRMTGRELMEKGLRIDITQAPGAALVTYKKVK